MQVDYLGVVAAFIYLGKAEIEERNLSKLVHYHESYLNNAIYSYENGIVTDWISFLREDWASVLFFDKYKKFVTTLRNLIQNDKGVISIIDKIFEISDSSPDDHQIDISRRKILGDRCFDVPETTKKTVEVAVVEFLRENKYSLPKYYVPQMSQLIGNK